MNIETSTLTGNALNWAVNDADGLTGLFAPVDYCGKWEFGGPIIEREKIGIDYSKVGWIANADTPTNAIGLGSTPLIAAMRCYVASQFGDTVDVPEELV
jgi:hypothetical protein